jgi:hypothetical protein
MSPVTEPPAWYGIPDDFIIAGAPEVLTNEVRPLVERYLAE